MIVIRDASGPLCPQGIPPVHPAHQQHVDTLDAFYEAAERDASGDMTPPLDTAYQAANTRDRMNLYVSGSGGTYNGRAVSVEAWYFRCRTCGFVLPAQVNQR